MKIEKDQLDQLKKDHPSGLYEGAVSFVDEEGKSHQVEFLYRKPSMADLEAHTRTVQRNPMVANLNILQSLIVHPEPGPVIERIQDYPGAYARFMDEVIGPFFGSAVEVTSRKL